MRIYAVYLFVIAGLLAVSGAQAESLVPPHEHFFEQHYRLIMMKISQPIPAF
jgi:hypothetical protein